LAEEFYRYRVIDHIFGFPSFKVKLLKIHYIDTKAAGNDYWSYGFALEDKRDLAKRLGLQLLLPSDEPCTEEELKKARYEECSYMNFKLIKARRQEKKFWNLVNTFKGQTHKLVFRFESILQAVGGSIDHGFAGNNSTILYKVKDNKLESLVVPYDFDRYSPFPYTGLYWLEDFIPHLHHLEEEVALKRFNLLLEIMKEVKSKKEPLQNYFWEYETHHLPPPRSILAATKHFAKFSEMVLADPQKYFNHLRNPVMPIN